MKITKKQQMKMIKKARREAELEQGRYAPTVIHKTSKKDQAEKLKNTLNQKDIGE